MKWSIFGKKKEVDLVPEKQATKEVQPYVFRNQADKTLWIELLKFYQTKMDGRHWTLTDPGCRPRTIDAVEMTDHILHNIRLREKKR